jgi:hypothetical protein
MSDISPSALKLTPEQEAKVMSMDRSDDITEYLKEVSVQNGLLKRDWDPALFIAVEQTAPQPRGYAKTIIVNGVKTILEGATEQELLAKENAFMRQTFEHAATTTQTQQTQPRDESTGRFVPVEQTITPEERANLDLQFSLGQVSISQYLEQSGEIEKHIERREQSTQLLGWESATESFLQSAEGASWPGGNEALARIGQIIQASGLEDASDKLDVLKQAYALMQQEEHDAAAHTQEVEAERIINETTDPYKLRAMLQNGSGFFGR